MKVSVSIQEQNTLECTMQCWDNFYVVLHCEGHVKLHANFNLSCQTSKNAKVQAELKILKDCFPSVAHCSAARNHFVVVV